MQTWMIMMGIQMIIFVICAVWVGIWMNRPDDEYDEALEKHNAHSSLKTTQQDD